MRFVRLAGAVAVAAAAAGCSTAVDGAATADGFTPAASNPDPSVSIEGITVVDYPVGDHVGAEQRVAYDRTPPFGGPHDSVWATCTGTVYDVPIRNENAVHSLEHGAVWIAYDPARVSGTDRDRLVARVEGQPYMLLSPYPGLPAPVSLQSWGHQLTVDDTADERIDEFIGALRLNPDTYPEPGATCSTIPGMFDPSNPPPLQPDPPDPASPNTVPMN
ncbi:DUF3105 domain-containing protein [Prescottella subtropica]|uniref:DUF3105 domain-containing protein n=1 Tax=Prescottella subtropica TaxID=2545757 RepID=UPI0010F8BC16|nr:DUF3105 domain-containing protein [Prescottella subtropica]